MKFLITTIFTAFDMVSGLAQSLANGTYQSKIMRQGLYHKLGLIMVMALGILIDYAQTYIDLGVSIPVAGAVCVYISLMEIGSIVENICKLNPEVMPDKLLKMFGQKKEG